MAGTDQYLLDAGKGVVVRRLRLRDRFAARRLAGSLDRELARGVAPASRASLAVRAHAQIGPPARVAMAARLERVVHDARVGRRSRAARVPVRRGQVLAAAEHFETLARRLLGPEPVSARGVAEVQVLLRDGSGPLYDRDAAEDLRAAVARALHDLDVRAPA
jgi:regulator of extracellular matrix RemA (YlzA/DUF370 family)